MAPKQIDPRAIEAMQHYRRVRDEIKAFFQETVPEKEDVADPECPIEIYAS